MRRFNKQLIAAAAASASMAVIGIAWAQTTQVPSDTAPAPINSGNAQILVFQDQGNSPETNPSAHLNLIKDEPAKPMAAAEPAPATQVAEATPAPAAAPAPAPEPAPAVAAPSTSDDMSSHTDGPPPKADRN